MSETRPRYPGAQSFSDDDLSRKVFFGREDASRKLADQILANRMVVVYGRSGLGKTSLLNAGVAQPLRDEEFLPLIVRVNDVDRGPLASVFDGISAAAERQQVEMVPGNQDCLWDFFKTVEFWRGDMLLTPVLILDQFEELFTLQAFEAQSAFIDELGFLVRGIRPIMETPLPPRVTETPPALRIVLSLREDFLGFLDEAADRIPQILDQRFRLKPLSVQAAAEAIAAPAAIDDQAFLTRCFTYTDATVQNILDYLSLQRSSSDPRAEKYVEPFQLQLVCQHAERIVAERQRHTNKTVSLTLSDLGGQTALQRTLTDFYRNAIAALSRRRHRQAARQLCEEYLISPEGRRLSVEEHEIERQLKIPTQILGQLVDRRLLRSDHRSDSVYYELSHDTLVEPILTTRRRGGIAWGCLGMLFALIPLIFGAIWTIWMVSGAFFLLINFDAFLASDEFREAIGEIPPGVSVENIESITFVITLFGCFVTTFFGIGILYIGYFLMRRSIRMMRRFRRRKLNKPRTRGAREA